MQLGLLDRHQSMKQAAELVLPQQPRLQDVCSPVVLLVEVDVLQTMQAGLPESPSRLSPDVGSMQANTNQCWHKMSRNALGLQLHSKATGHVARGYAPRLSRK